MTNWVGSIFGAFTRLSSIGMLTISTRWDVIVVLQSHSSSMCGSTCVPWAPTWAIVPPARNDRLAQRDRGGHADGFDGRIDATAVGQCQDRLPGLAARTVDDCGRAETAGHLEPIVIEIDHDDFAWRMELRGQERGKADRTRADDRDSATGAEPCH